MAFWKRWKSFPSEDIMTKLKIPVSAADHTQGPDDAPVILVEYGDYECPHCGHAYGIVKALQKKFGEQLRFVFRNFPLREAHPYAEAAAEAAEFAGAHGKFWEMHDLIYENQDALSEQLLAELAQRLRLDVKALAKALETGEFANRVKKDFVGGVRSGVNGTPTFFINGERHDADFELETLTGAIGEEVAKRAA
jgi:protein-disulfide isomerase